MVWPTLGSRTDKKQEQNRTQWSAEVESAGAKRKVLIGLEGLLEIVSSEMTCKVLSGVSVFAVSRL